MLGSILICTRNRANSLSRTLESLAQMVRVSESWELVIVDNGSTDGTPRVISSFEDRLPIRRVVEEAPGLSNARNCGVAAARGKYLLWTDDDVLVDRNWLQSYISAFSVFPDAAVFGGLTEPRFLPPVANWMPQHQELLKDLLAIRDFGPKPIPLSGNIIPYGLNYCIKRAVQTRYLYDPNLGVAPGRRMGGEETAVITAILKDGNQGYWLPEPKIIHLIPPVRQTRNYVHEYYQSHGRATAHWPQNDTSPRIFNVPRWRFRRLLETFIRYHLSSRRSASVWLPYLIEYSTQEGWIAEWLRKGEA